MNQKVRRQIKRLYRYLLNIASSGPDLATKICGANGAGLGAKDPEAENSMAGQTTILERVVRTLQAGRVATGKAVFVCKFHACVRKTFLSKCSEAKKVSKHTCRKIERPQKRAFEALRVTLNLARGNIETNVVQPALAACLRIRLGPASNTVCSGLFMESRIS